MKNAFPDPRRLRTLLLSYLFQIQHALSLPFSERGGETNTQAALQLVHTLIFTVIHGDRPAVPNVAVVVTDGRSTVQANRTLTEAATVRRSGVQVYVIGVGDDADQRELRGIASTPYSHYVVMMGSNSVYAAGVVLDRLCR